MQPLLVGFIFSPKKIGHPTFRSLIEATRKFARVVIIDFSRPIEEQGDFNVIYHKLTDWMSAANEETKRLLERFDRYCAAHPAVRIVEPVHNLDVLLDRVSTCEAFAHFDVTVTAPPAPAPDSPHTFRVRWPASVVVSRDRPGTPEAFRQAGLEFPVVAKPAMACGLTLKAHQFVLAYEMADLERAGILESPEPYLLQRLVPHRGAVHKVYVIGDHVECALRDSLPPALHAAATATTEWRTFNSQKMGPSGVALTETSVPPVVFLRAVTEAIKQKLGLELFGYDLIASSAEPGTYYLVDINYLPSYTEVDDAVGLLTDHLRRVCDAVGRTPAGPAHL